MLKFEENFLMKRITTLQIGGPAKYFVIVKTITQLTETVAYAREKNLPFIVIGGGSNLLVNDLGADCLVIKNETEGIVRNGHILTVQSGTILQNLVNFSLFHGLFGLQKLTGIPGTVGGAVYGNAGAYGQTISDFITEVYCFNGQKITTLPKKDCEFNYRDSGFKKNGYAILEIKFQLQHESPQILTSESKDILSKRLVKYPPGIRCPGSFFKNLIADTLSKEVLDKIPLDKIVYGKLPAGALLEMVGAKGDSLDGIYIADYHANLFINKDSGTADAFYKLAKKYAQLVKERFGITLEPEVQLINLPPI